MSSLLHIPRNGQSQKKANLTHKGWSNWIDDLFPAEHFPSVFTSHLNTNATIPKVNIKETKDVFVLELAAPGLEKSDFKIDIDTKTLTVATAHQETATENETNYTRKEFAFTAFKRVFSLPESIDDAKIEAKYNAGVLEIVLPKREEAKEKPPRTIAIS